MKKCPSCGRSYTDAALNFCLEDGTVLEQETVSTFGNEETVFMGGAPSTNPGQPSTNPGQSPYNSPNNPPATWTPSPYGAQPKKRKSRAWIFILLALFMVGVIGVAGFFGFLVYLGMKMEKEAAANKSRNSTNNSAWNANKARSNSNAVVKTGNGEAKKADFSKWATGSLDFAKVEYKDGDLIVSALKNNYFCAIPAIDLFSNNATTRVTVKNDTKAASSLGYGLVVHSSPIKALLRDYAFLIRTDGTPSYRIVSHSASIEKDIVKWTPSSAIEGGDDINLLEVRDEGKKLSFYINGELVNSIDDAYDDDKATAGIYTANLLPITFSDLEVEPNK